MFDFGAARQRWEELVSMYRTLRRTTPDDDTWSWWIQLQISEIDADIASAHQNFGGVDHFVYNDYP